MKWYTAQGCAFAMMTVMAACCPKNPSINSAITAHGNTDWHIDTAEEFLYGTDMNGTASAANHVPSSWSRRHMHTGLTNTADYYYDSDRVSSGDDTDAQSGIDQAMLFFYAGHGQATSWDVLGGSASQGNMCLGNCRGNGLLRYYWQCSCEVFAHGPHNCSGSTHAYACPEDFDGSSDSWNMRNVYERWGPVLDSDLRMACGASTEAFCHESQTNRIWNNYNNNGFDVADSFIDGLSGGNWVVPLCITTGGFWTSTTPLFDQAFTNDPNPSGDYYHIQFLSQFETTVPDLIIIDVPERLPILEVIPLPLPEPLRAAKLMRSDGLLVSEETVEDRGPRVRIQVVSGAVYIRGPRELEVTDPLSEEEYLKRALEHVEEQGWSERDYSGPHGASNRVMTTSRKEPSGEARLSQKNTIVRLRRVIDFEGQKLPVFGEGGLITVQMNNDGSLLNASKVWRPVKGVKALARVKSYDDAYREAIEVIQDTAAYRLDDWLWGYKEAAGNVEQGELRVFYRFEFLPRTEELKLQYPPRMVEIRGHIE